MSEDRYRGLLNDYLDGQLERELRDETRAHLEGCPECRRELEQLRSLLSVTDRLPRSIEPPRDLWPGVVDQLGARPRPRARFLRPRYAVAAVALLAIAFSLTQVRTKKARERTAPPVAAPQVQPGAATVFVSLSEQWRQTEAAYERAATELMEAIEVIRGELPAETVERFEANLRIVDDAIRESRQALEADPENFEVLQLLAAVHEKKLDLLQRTTRLDQL